MQYVHGVKYMPMTPFLGYTQDQGLISSGLIFIMNPSLPPRRSMA
jgi:hypothetical protein